MHVGILPICVSEYAKEIHAALWSPETRKSLAALRENPRECCFAAAFALAETVFALALPAVLAAVIDVGIAGMDAGYILICGMIAILFEALRLVCSIFARRFASRASARLAASLRREVFAHARRFGTASIDDLDFSVLMSCFSGNVSRLQTGISDVLPHLPHTPAVTLAALIAAFTTDGSCGCVFTAAILTFGCIGAGITLVRIPLARRIRECGDDLLRGLRDGVDIRLRSDLLKRFRRLSDRLCALLRPLTLLAFGLSAAALLRIGVQIGLSHGRIAVLLVYLAMTAAAHVKSANRIFTASEAGLCGRRIGTLLGTKPWMGMTRIPAFDATVPAWRASNLSPDLDEEVPA